MDLLIKLFADILGGVLNALGGFHWLFCRRFILPFVIGVSASIVAHAWWLGIAVLPAMGTLCLGYPSGANWGRGFWLFIQAVAFGLGITALGHLTWFVFIPYAIGAGVLGGLYKNIEQVLGDFITGCYLSGIIFFVR